MDANLRAVPGLTLPARVRSRFYVAFALFFASGAAGLIYQVVWSRMLQLVVGVSIYAITAVICTFMAGMALGSWLIGRYGERLGDPLRVYGGIEAIIGVYALITPLIFEAFMPVYIAGFQVFDGAALQAFRVVISAGLLLLPTALMGGTLPLLARAVTETDSRAARGAGLLYGVNTLGAVAGCLGAGFFLIGKLGMSGSLWVAASLNFAVAAIAFLVPRSPGSTVRSEVAASAVAAWGAASRFVPTLLFATGFAALGYELLWTRALLIYVRSSTYAFSVMLGVYLLGIALGSLAIAPFVQRMKRPLLGVAWCNVGIVLSAAFGLVIFPEVDRLALAAIGATRLETFGQAAMLMLSQAGIILLAPTIFMGAMFPLAIAAYSDGRGSDGRENVGRSVGLLYALNTSGNIVGSVVIGFLAIASFGVRTSILGMMAINLSVAAAIGIRESKSVGWRVLWPAAALALLLAVDQGVSRQIFFETFEKPKGSEIIYYREGATDTVAVIERKQPASRTLVYSDGRGAAGTPTLLWNLYLGHLPMLLNPDPQEVLHVCFGSGNSLMAIARHDPERIDMAELSPHVRETAKYFWTNEDVANHPAVNLVIEDGRNFLLGTESNYDVVSLEPPNLFSAGVVNLYTQEFYELVLEHLKPGGIMLQWLPTDQLTETDRGHLLRAFTEAFPQVTIWQQLESPVLLLLGSREPLQIDLDEFRARFDAAVPKRDREKMKIYTAEGFLSFFRLGDAATRALAEPYAPSRDDHTIIDYSIPHYVGAGFGFALYSYALGEKGHQIGDPAAERMQEFSHWRDPFTMILPDRDDANAVQAIRTERDRRTQQRRR